jgi:hypothetical protein
MNRRELEQTRDRVEEQLRWALVHDGDQELLDLLPIESERLSLKITAMSRCPDQWWHASDMRRALLEHVPAGLNRRDSPAGVSARM